MTSCVVIHLIGDTDAANAIVRKYIEKTGGKKQIPTPGGSFIKVSVDIKIASKPVNVKFCVRGPKPENWYSQRVFLNFQKQKYGMLLVYDVNNQESFLNIEEQLCAVKEGKYIPHVSGVVLIGNNCRHQRQRIVSIEDGGKLAQLHEIQFFETGTNDGMNVELSVTSLIQEMLAVVEKIEEPWVTLPWRRRSISTLEECWSKCPTELGARPKERMNTGEILPDLYKQVLMEGVETDCSVRVNIVGIFRHGKTSILKRLLNQSISGVTSTNLIDVYHSKCKTSKKGQLVCQKARNITTKDVEDRLKVAKLKQHPPVLKERSHSYPLLLRDHTSYSPASPEAVGIKLQEESTKESAKRDLEREAKYLLTDKQKKHVHEALLIPGKSKYEKHGKYFDFWDFGGQLIFYSTHCLFHSRHAIYLLVFDLSVPLDRVVCNDDYPELVRQKTVEDFFRLWMNSIHGYVGTREGFEPVVILVGTHRDKLTGSDQEITRFCDLYFEAIRTLFDGSPLVNHIYEKHFAVNNCLSNDKNVALLRKTIIEVSEKNIYNRQTPAKWIQLEQRLNVIKDRKILSLKEVVDIDKSNEIPLGTYEDIKAFLLYHHDKGALVYFDEESISDYVVLDPQFLVDAFKCIITSKSFCPDRKIWNRLVTEARLEHDLIDSVWGKNDLFRKHKKKLIRFLEKHRIISEAKAFDETTNNYVGLDWYIVPCFLRSLCDDENLRMLMHERHHTKLQFVLEFENPASVSMIFPSLIAALVNKWPLFKIRNKTIMLFQDLVIVEMEYHAGVCLQKEDKISLAVVSLRTSLPVNPQVADAFRRYCENVVQHEFTKLKSEIRERPYRVKYLCNDISHEGKGSECFVDTDVNEIYLPCPDNDKTHEICVREGFSEWHERSNKINDEQEILVTEQMLTRLSGAIGQNWELLAAELNITQVEIDHIKAQNITSTPVLSIFKMFLKWKQKTERAQLCSLLEVIAKNATVVNVDWDIIRNVADESGANLLQ